MVCEHYDSYMCYCTMLVLWTGNGAFHSVPCVAPSRMILPHETKVLTTVIEDTLLAHLYAVNGAREVQKRVFR